MTDSMAAWPRIIAIIDLDAFYVSVELRRRPELRGRPVVVAGTSPRSVVTTASYEARQFGIGSAMPSSQARRLCPEAIFLAPDFAYYRAASKQVMGIIRSHVDRVEVIGLDEAYLDLGGLPAPKAGMRRIVRQIREETGLVASVGMGPNKLVAKMASDAEKPNGFVVLGLAEAQVRFADSPCRLIPGIGQKTAERLGSLDIHTISQLARARPETLGVGFAAPTIAHLQALARLEHDGVVTQERKVISESRSRTLDVDIVEVGELEKILSGLAAALCDDLVRRGRRGRTIGISVRLSDFSNHSRARTLNGAVAGLAQVEPVALELLRGFLAEYPGRAVRLLGVRVAGLEEPREEVQLALAL